MSERYSRNVKNKTVFREGKCSLFGMGDKQTEPLTIVIQAEVKSLLFAQIQRPIILEVEKELEFLCLSDCLGEVTITKGVINKLRCDREVPNIKYVNCWNEIHIRDVTKVNHCMKTNSLKITNRPNKLNPWYPIDLIGSLDIFEGWEFRKLITNIRNCSLTLDLEELTVVDEDKHLYDLKSIYQFNFPHSSIKRFNSPNVFAQLNSAVPCDEYIGKALRKELINVEDL